MLNKIKDEAMAMEKSISKQRAEACLEVFHRILPQCESVEEAFERAAKEPAPKFFVSFSRAYRCVSELERHDKRVTEPTKAAMVDELHRRWKARGVKHYACLEEIIEEPAPSFYIAPSTLRSKRKKRTEMEEIRKAIESVIEKVKARGGAIICYVDADGNGKNCRLFSEGKMGNLAILIGTAVMSDDECGDYILKGIEAAKVAMSEIKKINDVEAEC